MHNHFIFIQYFLSLFPKYIFYTFKRDYYYLSTTNKYLLNMLFILKSHHNFQYDILADVVGADYLSNKNRFQLLYNLLSFTYSNRIFIKLNINELGYAFSIIHLFANANWYERECWDLFGIYFINNPDLRRILTDYGFIGHPLKKDFPLSGFSEISYSELDKRIIYRPVSLIQELRTFVTLSPWKYHWHFSKF